MALFTSVYFFIPNYASGERQECADQLASVILKVLELAHFSQAVLEDVEACALSRFADSIDPQRLLLSNEDIKEAGEGRRVREDMLSGRYAIRDFLISRAIANGQSIAAEVTVELAHPHSTSDDTVPVVWEQLPRCKNWQEMRGRWSLYLQRAKLKGEDGLDPNAVVQELTRRGGDETREFFLKAVAGSFDPHTDYFGPHQQQVFTRRMELNSTTSGLKVERGDGGEVKVKEARATGVKEGTEVLGVVVNGDILDARDLSDQRLEEVTDGRDGQEVQILLQGEDNVTKITPSKDDANDAGRARAVLILFGGRKVGLITLPMIYGAGQISSGGDFRQLLERLSKAGAEAVVVDLRGNAGGGINEAIEAAGALMGDLVVAIGVDRTGKLREFRGRGKTMFSGPVVCLIDADTGSAAEILAGAIQDHQRGVVVGGGRTAGKWTSQAVVDLGEHGFDKGGALKVSTVTMAGPNGQERQGVGVSPDILLPCGLEAARIIRSLAGIEEQVTSTFDQFSARKKTLTKNESWELANQELRKSSLRRISNDEFFALVDRLNHRVKGCLRDNSLQDEGCADVGALHAAIMMGREGRKSFPGEKITGGGKGDNIEVRLDPYEEEAVQIAREILGALPTNIGGVKFPNDANN